MLALLCAKAGVALLRLSAKKVLETKQGETLTSDDFVNFFNHELPGQFSEAMTLSLAQNVASSWTQAGYFKGKVNKVRARPLVTPATAAYALALGYALLQKSIKGGLAVVGSLNLGGSVDPVHNAVNVAELAISKGASTLLVPVSARKQLNDLPDDLITKVNILYYTDAREALLKAIVE